MAKWKIDPDHSVAAFSVRHLLVANVRGQFNKLGGTIVFDPEDPAGASVEVAIEAGSILTGVAKRDEDLMSPNFLNVEEYPEIVFKSESIAPLGDDLFKVSGSLSLHGVTRPVVFEIKLRGPVISPFGGEKTLGFSGSATINREEFGITWNVPMEAGGFMVASELALTLDVEADLVED